MKHISLLGCGKLGYPLAIELLKQGHVIKGSTTTITKMSKLKNIGIIPYLIDVDKKMKNDTPCDFNHMAIIEDWPTC